MNWNAVLNNWEKGVPFTYPSEIKHRFQWNTSVLKNNGNCKFSEAFMIDFDLPQEQDMSAYVEVMKKSKNKYSISFESLSKGTFLVIPRNRKNKNFCTIKDFVDNASRKHQQKFWQEVSRQCKIYLKKNKRVYVSAHGHGVPYFHLRIEESPKRYFCTITET
jgi:protease II